ncbi:nonstructural protein [Microviridae sp.]|nr:nonstructural protein [Microviridae sp.]
MMLMLLVLSHSVFVLKLSLKSLFVMLTRSSRMSIKVCTVYDSKSESYMLPMYFKHRGDAVRSFTEAATDKSTTIGKYPADFTLFELGSFCEASGKFVLNSTPISIGCALEFLSIAENSLSRDEASAVYNLAQKGV